VQLDSVVEYLDERGERERSLLKNIRKHQANIEAAIEERENQLMQSLMSEPVRRSSRVRERVREQDLKNYTTYINRYDL